MFKISVSVLNKLDNLKNVIQKLNNTSCDYIHIDVMDGIFVDNTAFSDDQRQIVVNNALKPLDVHLMVENPLEEIKYYIKNKASIITLHLEVLKDSKYLHLIKDNNIKVGLSLNPETKVELLEKYLNIIDNVLIMSVSPGYGNQQFDKSVLEKVKTLYKIREEKNLTFKISIDGGVNNMNFKESLSAGVDTLVIGTYIVNSNDYEEKLNSLRDNH